MASEEFLSLLEKIGKKSRKYFLFIILCIIICSFIFYKHSEFGNLTTAFGTIISIISILLSFEIFHLSNATQDYLKKLTEEIHSLEILNHKTRHINQLKDFHSKAIEDSTDKDYWYYRYSFEMYDYMTLLLEKSIIRIEVLGTTFPPFELRPHQILSLIYIVKIIESDHPSLPIGTAYCSFEMGKKYISIDCDEDKLHLPKLEFMIATLGADYTHWVSDKPKFYKRLVNTDKSTSIQI